MLRATALLLALAACGGPTAARPPEPPSGPDLSPALAPIAWLVGDWHGEAGDEHWVATAGVLYGVGFHADGGYELMIIDDAAEDAAGAPDGTLRLYAMPAGAAPTLFTAVDTPRGVRFENPAHDDPTAIAYAPDGAGLTATVTGPRTDLTLTMTPQAGDDEPEALAADRAFAAATDARGADGWVAAFATDGAMLRGDRRLEGPDAVRAAMAPLLGRASLLWAPTWSRRSPDGRYAATVGRARLVERAAVTWRGSYLTLWRHDPDGWKVVVDVGRDENPL